MPAGVHKQIDLVGTSPRSIKEAIRAAISEASKTLRLAFELD